MQSLVKRMLDLFEMIYMLQKSGRSFENVDEMLQTVSVNFPSFANQTLREHLKSQISSNEKLIDELAQAITLVNYGQSVDDLHAFVGSVSIAGSGGGLWSIEGGNELLPKALAGHSEAKLLLETAVFKLKLLANGKYELTDSNSNVDTYDMVILAHPLTHTKDVYKVFSRAILSEEQLNLLFAEISAIEVIPWMAYPD
ncbi:Farnesylcysteine lyase [Halotydeus destructor]|nr:Farnesylcysteine lyase [Halotydeus destructor]